MTGSPYPTKVYTDHSVLLSLLQGEGMSYKGRLSSWLIRMSEYDVEYVHVKREDNVWADGMSRMPVLAMSGSSPTGDWEDMVMAGEVGENPRMVNKNRENHGEELEWKTREGRRDRKEDQGREKSGSGNKI